MSVVSIGTAFATSRADSSASANSATFANEWNEASPYSIEGRSEALSIPTRSQITTCYNGSSRVWLTFDDGGTTKQVNRILDILKKNNVKGMFFPTGAWASANPGLMKRILRDGHIVGNHSYNHLNFAKITDASVRHQIALGVRGNAKPRPLLRTPYGADTFSTRMYNLASAKGYNLCYWTVDTRDWDGSSVATIIHRVRYGDAYTNPVSNSGVVLMHMQGKNTGAALQGVIDAVKARGLDTHHLDTP